MARGFRIHSNAVFNPFSYQELIAPLNEYEQAYGQMQDAMLAAGEEANQYKQLIDIDPYASGILNRYNNTLSEMSSKLSSDGLKSINRNSLLNLRRQYNNEVKPINDAAKTLASLQDTYRQAYMKDNTLMRGAMPSIRDLVENPGATPQVVSGSDLYKQGAQAAQASSARIYNTAFGDRIDGYIQQVAEQGYSPELVAQFIQDASSIPELARDMQNIRRMYNTQGLEDRGYKADQYIMQGILDGISYQRKDNFVKDWQLEMASNFAYNQKAADAAYQRQANLATLKAGLKAGISGSGSGSRVSYNSRLKDAWYIRDGKEVDLTTSSKDALEEAMKDTKMVTVSPSELTLENKVRVLKAIGVDALDLTDGFGELNEDAIEEAFEYYTPFINSQYILRQANITGKRDAQGNKVPRDQRVKSDEFLMVPKDIKRDVDNSYLSGYGYESDDDITFD